MPQCTTKLCFLVIFFCGISRCAVDLTTDISWSPWPQPREPGLEEGAFASMVFGTERVLNEYLLNDFQLMEES